MKFLKGALGIAIFLVAVPAVAEIYEVYVKRIDSNLYRTSNGLYIETRYCYEYAYGERAILRYERYSYDNKLIFENGSCDVVRVFK